MFQHSKVHQNRVNSPQSKSVFFSVSTQERSFSGVVVADIGARTEEIHRLQEAPQL